MQALLLCARVSNASFNWTRHWAPLKSPQQWQERRGKSLKVRVCCKGLSVRHLTGSQVERREERLTRNNRCFGGGSTKLAPGGPGSKRLTPLLHPGWGVHPWLCAAPHSLGCGASQVPGALPNFFGWRCALSQDLSWLGRGEERLLQQHDPQAEGPQLGCREQDGLTKWNQAPHVLWGWTHMRSPLAVVAQLCRALRAGKAGHILSESCYFRPRKVWQARALTCWSFIYKYLSLNVTISVKVRCQGLPMHEMQCSGAARKHCGCSSNCIRSFKRSWMSMCLWKMECKWLMRLEATRNTFLAWPHPPGVFPVRPGLRYLLLQVDTWSWRAVWCQGWGIQPAYPRLKWKGMWNPSSFLQRFYTKWAQKIPGEEMPPPVR